MKDSKLDADKLRAPTVDASGRRRWLYPERRQGRLIKIRRAIAMALMAIYLIVPFSSWQSRPLLRLDVLESKAFAFGFVFPFHDASYLVFLFIALALALFLVTALYGRLWCGYACPQTVFVEWLIRPIESFFEGPASRRMVRDKGPLNWDKAWRKLAKYSVYIVVISVIANAFLAYFVDYRLLSQWITSPPSQHPWAFSIMLFISAALFLDLVWFREQFCSFLCPYARFQSVMIDRFTPTIAYDSKRGEPRTRKRNGGDCIDCGLCVRVCPTGIDIRNGLQMECIQCGRCADACDEIQTNLKRPKGLIRTASLWELEKGRKAKLRPRPFLYGLGLVITFAAIFYRLGGREELEYTIIRQPSSTYSEIDQDYWGNYFSLRINSNSDRALNVSIQAAHPVSMICNICENTLKPFGVAKGLLVIKVPKGYQGSTVELKLDQNRSINIPIIIPQKP